MAERSFEREVQDLRLRRRRNLSRRRHSRDHQSLAAIRRLLRRRLSGRADLASHGRARRRQGRDERPRRAFRDVRFGSRRRRDALGVGHVSGARRGDLEIDRGHQCRVRRAVEPRFERRHRRRADRHRRGLWRRLLDHAGAHPRLCDEVADLASRSAPQSADDGADGRGGLRTVGGLELAGHARSAHPLLSCAWAIRRQGQQEARLHAAPGAGKSVPRRQPHRAAARVVHAGEGEAREALAGRGRVHQEPQAQRIHRPEGGRRSASSCSAASSMACFARLQQLGLADVYGEILDPDLCPQCRLSDHRRRDGRILPRQVGGADGRRGRARLSRAGAEHAAAPPRHPDEDCGQGRAADGRRIHRAGRGHGRARLSPGACARAAAQSAAGPRSVADSRAREGQGARQDGAAAPARLLHRLPGASDLRRDETGRERTRVRTTSRPTSAAICSRSCRPSTSARRRWAMASGLPRPPRSM